MTGANGKLFVKNTNLTTTGGSSEIFRVKDWAMTFSHSPIETTCLGDFDKTYVGGLRNYQVTGTLLYFQETGSNFTLLLQNMLGGNNPPSLGTGSPTDRTFGATGGPEPQLARMYLEMRQGTEDSSDMTVYGFMTDFTITCAVGEVVSANFTFQVHGKPSNIDLK